jgi:hypothetical protein
MGAVPQVVTMPAAHPLAVRVAAVVAFCACFHYAVEYDLEVFWAAVEVFMTALVPDHTVAAGYLHRFVDKWVAQFVALGHVFERTRRHPNIPFGEACRIADALVAGRMVDIEVDQVSGRKRKRGKVKVQRRMWYRSLHQFVVLNEWVQAVMHTYNVTSEHTLLVRLHQVQPALHRRRLRPRAPLSAAHKTARSKLCRRLLGMYCGVGVDPLVHYLSRVCWIDSKVYYIGPMDRLVYAPPGVDMTDVDPRATRKSQPQKVVYYAVVNAVLGPIYFEWMTGTTDHHLDPHGHEHYTVRPPHPAYFSS